MAKNNIDNILKAASCVINTPSITLREACSNFGVSISPTTGNVIGVLFTPAPLLTGMLCIYNKITQKRKEAEEKERIKNEIICKQQAIIRKLQQENELNQQQIRNLNDTLKMLKNIISQINAA